MRFLWLLFYVGDGISGPIHWLYARLLWRIPGLPAPRLPDGWQWNVRKDGRGLYARHDS